MDFLRTLFDTSGFPARWQCGVWSTELGWLHILSDLATFGAYTAIPIVLVYFIRKRRDMPFPKIFWAFGMFIFSCGTVHLIEASIFWWPAYRLSGAAKLVMAVVSWITVISLVPLVPRALALPGLRKVNEDLRVEIEKRERAQRSLRDSEERHRSLVSALSSVLWTTDATGAFAELQPKWEAFTGQGWEQYRGFGWAQAFAPEDRERILATWRQSVAEKTLHSVKGRVWSRAHGDWRHFVAHGVPIADGEGGVREWICTLEDVTDHFLAEERFRMTVESSPNGMLLVDAAGKIAIANPAVEEIFGYGDGELLGHSLEELVPERFRSAHPTHREDFYAAPSRRRMGEGRELFALRKDGSEVPVEIGLNPVQTPEGLLVQASIVDITERRAAQLALTEKAAELERSNTELEQFANVASHDLQEPLRMVASFLQLLAERPATKADEESQEFIGYAVDGARRMQILIRDLLSLSRVGTQAVKFGPTDLEGVLDEVLLTLRPAVEESGAVITHDELPVVLADRGQLMQLFQNLVANAIKFHGDEPPHVHLSGTLEREEGVFSVTDNGIGIEPEYSERIFGIFQRLHSREKYEGTGIGLAICKKIVERHGGRIWVEPASGHGASFRFTLRGCAPRMARAGKLGGTEEENS